MMDNVYPRWTSWIESIVL